MTAHPSTPWLAALASGLCLGLGLGTAWGTPLALVGAVAFADVGRAWGLHGGPDADLGLLRDVGVGLRISNPRSSRGSIVHIDVAYPLDGPPDIQHLQFIIETATSF